MKFGVFLWTNSSSIVFKGSPLCGLRFLFVSESEFSFLGLIASNSQPTPHCAGRTHVEQCLIDVWGGPVSVSSPPPISGPVLQFGVQAPWAAAVPKPTPNNV